MTIVELISECIAQLGSIQCSIDEQEAIGLPIHRVKHNLAVLKEALEKQTKQNKASQENEAEQDEGEI